MNADQKSNWQLEIGPNQKRPLILRPLTYISKNGLNLLQRYKPHFYRRFLRFESATEENLSYYKARILQKAAGARKQLANSNWQLAKPRPFRPPSLSLRAGSSLPLRANSGRQGHEGKARRIPCTDWISHRASFVHPELKIRIASCSVFNEPVLHAAVPWGTQPSRSQCYRIMAEDQEFAVDRMAE